MMRRSFIYLVRHIYWLSSINDATPIEGMKAGREEKRGIPRAKEEKEGDVVVDTPHCYNASMNDEKVVYIPGATHLLVEFHRRCYTDRRSAKE